MYLKDFSAKYKTTYIFSTFCSWISSFNYSMLNIRKFLLLCNKKVKNYTRERLRIILTLSGNESLLCRKKQWDWIYRAVGKVKYYLLFTLSLCSCVSVSGKLCFTLSALQRTEIISLYETLSVARENDKLGYLLSVRVLCHLSE